MSKKILNKILIVAMVAIYGAVMFKYFDPKTNFNEIVQKKPTEKSFPKEIIRPHEVFQLIITDRDPFLNKMIVNKKTVSAPIFKKKSKKLNSIKALIWPKIEYYGFIRAKQHEKSRAILKINGERYNIRLGESINGVKIHEIYSDSVKIVLHGETKTIKKLSPNGNYSR